MSRRAVGEATHYHADYVAPRWAPLLAKVAQIGQHIFYRWPGAWGQPAAFTGRYIGEPRDPLALRPPPPASRCRATAEIAASPVRSTDGTAARRAPTTTSAACSTRRKGWTLNIPGPDDSDSAAAALIAAAARRPAAARRGRRRCGAAAPVVAAR